jgi:hypothetical protein
MTMTRRLGMLLFLILVLVPMTGSAQSFTRGQWNTWGTGTYGGALWVGSGVAPYDRFADGTNAAGLRMQQAERVPCRSVECLFSYASGGVYVPSLQQFVALLGSGHQGGGSNEVNVFDMRTGRWNPSGRPANPTVRLYVKHGATWPSSIAYGGIHLTAPLGLIDTGNDYAMNISPSQRGAQITCINHQEYAGITDMPGFNKIFIWGGFGFWDAPSGAANIGCTYDYTTNKYQFLDAETWAVGAQTNITAATWDPVHQVVLFIDELNLYYYNPAGTQGRRVHQLTSGDGCGSDGCSQYTMIWDPKRKRAVLFGGGNPRYYDLSGGLSCARNSCVHKYSISGAGISRPQGPGVLYDPVGDVYVYFPGGKSLVYINPDTWVGTLRSNSSSTVTPTTPDGGSGAGSHMYYRFWYWPEQDVYAALPLGGFTDNGVYIYAPVRSGQTQEPAR